MRLLSILSAVLCWLCLAAPADAQPNANYTAEVEIDVTSADAATARDKGMKQAYRGAFLAVARNLTSNDGVERLNSLTDDQLLNFISEAEVLSEKASDVRYMARLKVQINGELLKAYMQEQGIPLIVVTSANVIVVPVFREFAADAPLLWESDNLWRKAWENAANTGSINNYISVPADGINYAALDADKALQMNSLALDTVASHLGTRNIFVLDTMYNGIEGLKIVVMPYSGGNPQTIFVSGDRSPDLFDKAIKDVVRYIDSTIQSRRVDVSTATQGEILVIYNSAGLKDWVKTENVLRNMSNVKAVNVEAMGGAKVQFRISLIGSPDDLATALKAHQLTLRDNGGFYTLDKSIH